MKLSGFRDWFLPLALVGFAGPTVTFLPYDLFEFGRWAGGLALLVYVFAAGTALRAARPTVLVILAAYVLWCLVTTLWSPVPDLSIPKALALACVLPAFVLGGIDWAIRGQRANVFAFLWPYAAVAAGAAVLGNAVSVGGPDIELYEGASGGPNVLGALTASATPVAMWCLYRDRSKNPHRLLWLGLSLFFLTALYLSNSRAAYLLFAGIAAGFIFALRPKAAVPILAVIGVTVLSIALFAPEFTDAFVERNVYKYSDESVGAGVFANREREWAESYDAAVDGGWIGLGYGVSTGDSVFSGGYTAVGYGREKGNSQLAVIEETGIVGLALLLTLIGLIFLELWLAFRLSGNHDQRMQLGLVLGGIIGASLHAIFEAWWVAPGSVEFVYFWAIAGVGLGLSQAVRKRLTAAKPAYGDRPLRA